MAAQNVQVKGRVTDTAGEPLVAVTVYEAGNTSNGTVTDMDGNYSISAPESATLIYSCLGFEEVQEAVAKRSVINVSLAVEQLSIDAAEVVSIGYGSVARRDLTGSVSKVDMEDIVVSTDEKWMEFILKQLFSNSMKYRRETGPRITVRVKMGEKQKSLIVEDNGCGIAPEDRRRIFDKGFTGKNGRQENSRATGMGLYLSRKLCEKLGIGIACESEPGAYTRMILTFPDSDYHRLEERPE